MIAFGVNDYWAIEIKARRNPKASKDLFIACEDLAAKRRFIIYTGEDQLPSTHDTTILSVEHFLNELAR